MQWLMEKERVVALIDMDCFYVQVEQRDRPELWGKPTAVVQYNQWKGGGYLYSGKHNCNDIWFSIISSIIAVSYEARDRGVQRGSMRGEDAKKVCPEINLVQIPVSRGKSDLTKWAFFCIIHINEDQTLFYHTLWSGTDIQQYA